MSKADLHPLMALYKQEFERLSLTNDWIKQSLLSSAAEVNEKPGDFLRDTNTHTNQPQLNKVLVKNNKGLKKRESDS